MFSNCRHHLPLSSENKSNVGENSKYFQTAASNCPRLTNVFTKTFEKTNIFGNFLKTNIFAKIIDENKNVMKIFSKRSFYLKYCCQVSLFVINLNAAFVTVLGNVTKIFAKTKIFVSTPRCSFL